MKYFISGLLVFLFFSFSCLAAPEDEAAPELQTEDMSMDVIINDSVSGQRVIDSLITALAEKTAPDLSDQNMELVGVSLKSVAPVTPGSTSGLKAALLGVLGSYDPVIVEYEYRNPNSSYNSYLREIQPDYVWLCSCAILLVVLFCLFRLGGSILCKR